MYLQSNEMVTSVVGVLRRHFTAITLVLVGSALVVQGLPSLWQGTEALPAVPALQTAALIFLFAFVCEYCDSSLGMGYGTTLTPLLLILGYEPLHIVPAVLLSEAVTGFAAGLMHHHKGNVDLVRDQQARRTLFLLGGLSTLGALVAVAVAVNIPKLYFGLFISTIILAMGVIILLTARRRFAYRARNVVVIGTVAAFNKGLSGGGYGPLVTAGQVVSGVPAKHAVAITSLAEALTCVVGLGAYVLLHDWPDWHLAAPLAVGALFSVPFAARTVRRLPDEVMRSGVGVFTLILGCVALYKLLG